jgi:hypothetical protein
MFSETTVQGGAPREVNDRLQAHLALPFTIALLDLEERKQNETLSWRDFFGS